MQPLRVHSSSLDSVIVTSCDKESLAAAATPAEEDEEEEAASLAVESTVTMWLIV